MGGLSCVLCDDVLCAITSVVRPSISLSRAACTFACEGRVCGRREQKVTPSCVTVGVPRRLALLVEPARRLAEQQEGQGLIMISKILMQYNDF